MANWNLPTVNSNYLSFVDEINGKFIDSASLFGFAVTNQPVGAIRFGRGGAGYNIDEWDGTTWQPRGISLNSGGTGANTAAQARVNLGIGSLGTQNSNAVNITGGTIVGVTYSANDITTGVMPLARGGTGASLVGTNFGDVLLWNGTQIVLAAGANIRSFDGSYITQGIIPLARLGPVVTGPGPNGYDGINIYYANVNPGRPIELSAPQQPGMNFTNNGGTPGKKRTRVIYYNDTFTVQRLDDGYTVAANLIDISWDGSVVCYGGNINNLNADNIATGLVNVARMGTGVANSTTFLRGDGTWAVVSSSGDTAGIPSGLIALFDTNCPAGWTRVAALDNRFPIGGTVYGTPGGSTSHLHSIGLNTSQNGAHDHTYSGSVSGNASGNVSGSISGQTGGNNFPYPMLNGNGSPVTVAQDTHSHAFSANFNVPATLPFSGNYSGRTSSVGDHSHQVSGNVSTVDQYPPYLTVVYCRKN